MLSKVSWVLTWQFLQKRNHTQDLVTGSLGDVRASATPISLFHPILTGLQRDIFKGKNDMKQDSWAFDAAKFSVLELTEVGQEHRKRGGRNGVRSVEKVRKMMSSGLDALSLKKRPVV